MERKIGEIFEYNGEWHQCVEQPEKYDKTVCNLCDFHGIGNCELDRCSGTYRSDKSYVIFKKLKKVGEPYEHYGKLYQCYKLPMEIEIRLLPNNCNPIGKDNLVEIEIKQNKEDMGDNDIRPYDELFSPGTVSNTKYLAKEDIEENKLNLKPFDIQKAKEGNPVCTRDGRSVRILCFDAKRRDEKNIIALVPSKVYSGFEELIAYYNNGNYHGGHENDGDLMMSPERKSGWVNIYRGQVYNTFEKAEEARKIAEHGGNNCLKTIKIDWEE